MSSVRHFACARFILKKPFLSHLDPSPPDILTSPAPDSATALRPRELQDQTSSCVFSAFLERLLHM